MAGPHSDAGKRGYLALVGSPLWAVDRGYGPFNRRWSCKT
jgi:hypothetical protein